jgi:hypothetical protein
MTADERAAAKEEIEIAAARLHSRGGLTPGEAYAHASIQWGLDQLAIRIGELKASIAGLEKRLDDIERSLGWPE